MPLTSDPEGRARYSFVFSSGVTFRMFDGETKVFPRVTREALADAIGAFGLDEKLALETFFRFRDTFEAIAARKYAGGEQHPIIDTYDLGIE